MGLRGVHLPTAAVAQEPAAGLGGAARLLHGWLGGGGGGGSVLFPPDTEPSCCTKEQAALLR